MSGGTGAKSGETVTASDADTSGVFVTGGATVTLTDVVVNTSGASSSSDASSFTGLDAGVLANGGSKIQMTGGSVTTSGNGANGVFAYGSGTTITMSGTAVRATGQYAHGIMTSGGGAITATDVTADSIGANSATIATDRGGGTIHATGGTFTTSGVDSPGLYSTGAISADRATVTASGSESAVIEGANTIVVTDSTLSGTKKSGVMILQSMSGDAQGSLGSFTMTGGSISQVEGPLFFVTNATGTFTLTGTKTTASSGVLLRAGADKWGTSGSNGGHAVLVASKQTLVGDVLVDTVSDATVALSGNASLTGTVDGARTARCVAVSLDASSRWTVTGDSHVTILDDSAGIAGSTVTNIDGNGHVVRYDAATNPALGEKTFTLNGGGTLTPA